MDTLLVLWVLKKNQYWDWLTAHIKQKIWQKTQINNSNNNYKRKNELWQIQKKNQAKKALRGTMIFKMTQYKYFHFFFFWRQEMKESISSNTSLNPSENPSPCGIGCRLLVKILNCQHNNGKRNWNNIEVLAPWLRMLVWDITSWNYFFHLPAHRRRCIYPLGLNQIWIHVKQTWEALCINKTKQKSKKKNRKID